MPPTLVKDLLCPNCGSPLFQGVENCEGDDIAVCRDESQDPPTGCQAAWDIPTLKASKTTANDGPVQQAEAAPETGPPETVQVETPAPPAPAPPAPAPPPPPPAPPAQGT